ncbi:hypothetical protein QMA04_17905, partial [Planococcus sp. APC 3900]|nr:hypothetical protein [Planococcus sp. APC 3900]
MSSVINISTIEDTTLWKMLKNDFDSTDKEIAETLANNLQQVCKESYKRMKYFASLHPQYTLHDETHFLRVTELMAKIMPDTTRKTLNPIEIALLILSAHFHDQGMVLDSKELEELKFNSDFNLFKENWVIEHPNYRDILDKQQSNNISDKEMKILVIKLGELDGALLTDYIRKSHGKRSANYVISNFSDNPLWNIVGSSLAESVAKLCISHVLPVTDLTEKNDFFYDESIGGYQVNLVYLALILRLADILDFDRDRTPDLLYKTIHFSSNVSLLEWNKHRSVEGWVIDIDKIRFTMKCEHPAYEKAAREYMDWIDDELVAATSLIKKFPHTVQNYSLNLPQSVDRSRIQPKNKNYIYHDLEFSLSRDEIVKLLLTENLYKSPALCIRELLQNSLDALRHRKAQFKRDTKSNWEAGKIEFLHTLDEHGREIIECKDNGVGMDIKVITKFLTKAGRSYYRSPEFEKERASLAESNVDFDPCAQFGIGFMSCFMLGDEISIKTRKDFGPYKGMGPPLIVEINGLSGIVVIKEGDSTQEVGTTVKIVSRKKPDFFDTWVDKVKLLQVLDGYALATEFPIKGTCTIPEIVGSIEIPSSIKKPKTRLEDSTETQFVTFEQDLKELDDNLNGFIRTSFILDEDNKINIKNSNSSWEYNNTYGSFELITKDQTNSMYISTKDESTTCIDGILVCGKPGRLKNGEGLGWVSNIFQFRQDIFNIDIRGTLKPPLTPERTPPERSMDLNDSKWLKVEELLFKAQGSLWSQVLERLDSESPNGEVFWKLVEIHNPSFSHLSYNSLFNLVHFPVINEDREIVRWSKANDLGKLEFALKDDRVILKLEDGNYLGFNKSFEERIGKFQSSVDLHYQLVKVILSMSIITKREEKIMIDIQEPENLDKTPSDFMLMTRFSLTLAIPYS